MTRRLDVLGVRYRISSKGEVIFRCPAHDDRHASFSFNVKKGVGNCFACGYTPNTAALAKRLGFDAPAEIPEVVDSHRESSLRRWRIPPLGERGRGYLAGRGIEGPIVDKARFGECDGGLVIPWVGRDGYVLFPTVRTWSGEPKYVSPPGADKGEHLYGWHLGVRKQVVLVEGELDAVYLQQFGYPALALGTSHITEAQVRALMGHEVFILLDGDRAGESGAVSVYADLCAVCPTRILHPPRPADPSDLTRGELDSLLQLVDERQYA